VGAKTLGVGGVCLFALIGASAAHASPQRAARPSAYVSQAPTQRSLLELSVHPNSLVQVAPTRAAVAAVRAKGGTLVAPQLNVWRLRSGAAQALAPSLARVGALRVVEPERSLSFSDGGHLGQGDPLIPQEWWIHATGTDTIEPPGPGRSITVVDSGLDITHPEFSARPNTTLLNQQSLVGEIEFHGTSVSSLAAAPANGIGLVGMYPDAALNAWDASPDGDLTNEAEIKGILTAADRGPTVINLSLGSRQYDPLEEQAVAYAFGHGSLVVAAAGNDGPNGPLEYPASLPHVLTVAATNELGVAADFSSASRAVDLAAPGQDVPVAVPTTFDPSGYEVGDGTSFATPLVTGAAAWVATVRPTLDVTQLSQVMRNSAVDIAPAGWDRRTGFGQLNVPNALAVPTPPSEPQEPNEDIADVRAKGLFPQGHPPLTTVAKRKATLRANLDVAEDPEDVYRIVVPARKTVTVSLKPNANVMLWLWGPKSRTVFEKGAALKRDRLARSERVGTRTQVVKYRNKLRSAQTLYVDAWLPRKTSAAAYTLSISSR
jgi:hypothetical protein